MSLEHELASKSTATPQEKQLQDSLALKTKQAEDVTKKLFESVGLLETKNKQNMDLTSRNELLQKKLEEDSKKRMNFLKSIAEPFGNFAKTSKEEDLAEILKVRVKDLQEMQSKSEKRLLELKDENASIRLAINESQKPKIATSCFKATDFVLFVTNKNGFYEAYPTQTNHFLSEHALDIFPNEKKQNLPILGQIVEITTNVATAGINPYRLPVGAEYKEVLIERSN